MKKSGFLCRAVLLSMLSMTLSPLMTKGPSSLHAELAWDKKALSEERLTVRGGWAWSLWQEPGDSGV